MTKKMLALYAIDALKKLYPEAKCSLIADKPYELLMATRLSAQCTDKRVNIVTEGLFKRFPTLESFTDGNITDIENSIKSCGLYKTKARDLKNMAIELLERFGGIVPDTIEDLITLPGVGRKTANLIVGDIYGKPSVVVDTHCIRITNRLGLVSESDPYKIEMSLKKLLPPEESGEFCHRIVLFGRDICSARSPKCEECPLKEICKQHKNTANK